MVKHDGCDDVKIQVCRTNDLVVVDVVDPIELRIVFARQLVYEDDLSLELVFGAPKDVWIDDQCV